MTELEPVADEISRAMCRLAQQLAYTATKDVSQHHRDVKTVTCALSSAQSAISERDARMEELENLAMVLEAEANQMREVSIMNRHRAEAAEALILRLLGYVPEECFEGNTRWELVECKRSGGAWFGAEDFRAARTLASKIGGGE